VPAGLALYGAKQLLQEALFSAGGRRSQSIEKWVTPVKRWLQDFF
jgi:hypothetical protein